MSQDNKEMDMDAKVKSSNKGKKASSKKKKGAKSKKSFTETSSVRSGGRFASPLLLNSGIPDRLFVNPSDKGAGTDLWTPLICASGRLIDKIVEGTQVATLFEEQVYQMYYRNLIEQTDAKDYVSPAVFNYTAFVKWFEAISSSLQVYYNIESILAFNSVPSNNNRGLANIQIGITSEDRRRHRDLRDILTNYAIPHNLETWINYMYQNFSSCLDPQSPIIRLNYRGLFQEAAILNPADNLDSRSITNVINKCIELLENNDVLNIDAYIGVSARFKEDKARTLSPVSLTACHDINFITWWHNQPCVANSLRTPSATTTGDNLYYGLPGVHVDGVITASTCIYQDNRWRPGLYEPSSTWSLGDTDFRRRCNILYYDGNSTSNLLKSSGFNELVGVMSGIYNIPMPTTQTETAAYVNGKLPSRSFQRAQIHSIDNMRTSVDDAFKWLFM